MAMGKKRERQQEFWIATKDVVESPRNAFYDRLNEVLEAHKFDRKVEALCRKFYKTESVWKTKHGAGRLFSGAADWLLRRSGFRTRHCVAARGLVVPAAVSRLR